ncbi:MAG: hypothetical protein N2511_06420, partial [Thermodesulfovibrionales bacterium]|nr:hypothetical protein [Thermodesulfovibrionales bacterium]
NYTKNIKASSFISFLDDIKYHPAGEKKSKRGGFIYDKTKTLTIQDRVREGDVVEAIRRPYWTFYP